jgi:hypothetical protein
VFQNKKTRLQLLVVPTAIGLFMAISPLQAERSPFDDSFTFNMVVSAGAKTCVPNASARVTIIPAGQVEIMDVSVQACRPTPTSISS